MSEFSPAEAFKMIPIKEPTTEEMREVAASWYARVGHTFIDQWPEHLRALSFPTDMVEMDASLMVGLYGHEAEQIAARGPIAEILDARLGWQSKFVRLNSRSPKDAAGPDGPITCSGKQAVAWMMNSERCCDDICLFRYLDAPLFVCLREFQHMFKDGEFRCFAKGGEVIGVSRYFYTESPEHPADGARVHSAAEDFYRAHLADHYPDIVFDLYAPGTDKETLIEINPYGLSDPCLFGDYQTLEAVGGFRQFTA